MQEQRIKLWTNRYRFSLAGLMGVVVVIAFGCAALRYASDLWASAALTLAVFVLFTGILGVQFRRTNARAFWSGFQLFGWGYMVLVFGPWFNTQIGPQLLTTKLLGYLHEKLQATVTAPTTQAGAGRRIALADLDIDGPMDLYVANAANGQVVNIAAFWNPVGSGPLWKNFQPVGHSLLALFIALIGGMLARWFYVRQKQSEPSAEAPCI